MAWRLEEEPNGGQAIVIDGWEQGTAQSPFGGLNRMRSVNLSVPGEVSVGYPVTPSTVSGATLGSPIADSTRLFSYGTPAVPASSAQSYAILDDDGHIFEATSITGTWNYLSNNATLSQASHLDGCAYWLGYLFKTRAGNIDYWNGTIWVNAWKTNLTGTYKHFMYVASDNVLYITNGNYLASITAPNPAAFDPTNGATYSYTTTKLQLPVTDEALSLAEVGSGNTPSSILLIGGSLNAIYPWDKVSSTFALPIYVADSYIKNLVSANQSAFIFPGNVGGRGRIYITNGSQATLFFKIPDYLFNVSDPYYVWGDAIFHRNNLLFGCFVVSNATSATVLPSDNIWAIDLETKAFRSVSRLFTASLKGNAKCLIAATNPNTAGLSYIVGWDDDDSGVPGIGYSGTTAGIGSGDILTDRIAVGSLMMKKTFSQVEYKLSTPLESGESISASIRTDNDSQNLVFSPTPGTGQISGVAPVSVEKSQWWQVDITLTGNSPTSGCRLREIRIR